MYPVVNPVFPYVFAKGYYPRIDGEKLGGRVTRLLITPLLAALRKVCGDNSYLRFLDSFRYPLAGEFAMRSHVVGDIRIPSDWGLEIGVLSEVRRNYSNRVIAQVDIADNYDHKHQTVSADDASRGLSRMSVDISKAIFRKLATDGEIFSAEKFRTVKATYFREALDRIDSYYNDALMNGLTLDRHAEEATVELFAKNIMVAGETYLTNPMETPFLPSWNQRQCRLARFSDTLRRAVRLDMRRMMPRPTRASVLFVEVNRLIGHKFHSSSSGLTVTPTINPFGIGKQIHVAQAQAFVFGVIFVTTKSDWRRSRLWRKPNMPGLMCSVNCVASG